MKRSLDVCGACLPTRGSAAGLALMALLGGCGTESPGTNPSTFEVVGADGLRAGDGVGPDAGSDDAAEADAPTGALRGRVYLHDPVTDQGETTLVTLVQPISTDGTLHGPYANVWNCLNQPGGPKVRYGEVEVGAFCLEQQTAKVGDDGGWLHILPPTDPSDPEDPFAEVQMYHHVHAMHAYFKDHFGLSAVDYPLDALVNVNLYIDPKIAPLAGLSPGWQDFANAAFVPKDAFAAFHLPPRKADAIIFGQHGKTDLAYDASVIYHEYTHAMIGTTRLTSMIPDFYGIDHMPGALNEAFADYFAASMTNHPVIGAYAIAASGAHLIRDLSIVRRCPLDLIGEIHADGRILSSALWRVRAQIGAQFVDGVVLRAVQQFTKATSLQGAVKLILSEAEGEDAAMHAAFKKIFTEQGLIDCLRVKPWKDWKAEDTVDKVPYRLMGRGKLGGQGFPDGVPGPLQFSVALPSGTKAVTLRWQAWAPGFFSQPTLAIGVQPAKPVTLNLFDKGKIDAKAVMPMSPDPGDIAWQSVTLTGACLEGAAGKLYVLPLNAANADAEVTRMTLTMHTTTPTGPNLRTCK